MAKRKTMVAFNGSAAQEKELRDMISLYKDQEGSLVPVLQKAQEIYGYLPIEVQFIISQELGVSLEKVYGIATFYAQFTLNPKGVHEINVCLGTACYVKGNGAVLDRIEKKLNIKSGSVTPDGRFSLDSTRCIGACALAPVITISGDVYGQLNPLDGDAIDAIIDKYMDDGGQKV